MEPDIRDPQAQKKKKKERHVFFFFFKLVYKKLMLNKAEKPFSSDYVKMKIK